MSNLVNPYRFGAGAATDPNFASVLLLLHGEGADASQTITDNSSNGFTPATVGSGVEIDTAQFKFGSASILFNGSSYFDYSHGVTFRMGSSDFTFEMFVRFANVSARRCFCSKWGAGAREYIFDWDPTAGLRLNYSTNGADSTVISGAWSPSINTWYHVAATRSGSTIRLFADGAQKGSGTYAGAINGENLDFQVGTYSDGTALMNGWLDEIRITKGVARYTGAFTPPTAAFPNS